MEGLYYDPRLQKRIEAIELLNDWGYRVVDIDSTLYIVQQFYPCGDEGNETKHELLGQNITNWVYNQTQTKGLSEQAKNAFYQLVSTMPIRRRKFSSNVTWKEYLSEQAHNI